MKPKLRIPAKVKGEKQFVLMSVRLRKPAYEKVRVIAKRTGYTMTDVLQMAIDNIE